MSVLRTFWVMTLAASLFANLAVADTTSSVEGKRAEHDFDQPRLGPDVLHGVDLDQLQPGKIWNGPIAKSGYDPDDKFKLMPGLLIPFRIKNHPAGFFALYEVETFSSVWGVLLSVNIVRHKNQIGPEVLEISEPQPSIGGFWRSIGTIDLTGDQTDQLYLDASSGGSGGHGSEYILYNPATNVMVGISHYESYRAQETTIETQGPITQPAYKNERKFLEEACGCEVKDNKN